MDLVLIFGAGAVGKMTVGQELMKISDFRLFHNHMMIEPVIEIFGEYNPRAVAELREVIFREYMKTSHRGMIFTFMPLLNQHPVIIYQKNRECSVQLSLSVNFFLGAIANFPIIQIDPDQLVFHLL